MQFYNNQKGYSMTKCALNITLCAKHTFFSYVLESLLRSISLYSFVVTPNHFLNALRNALGSEKPRR
jgi:hypothetical protein